MTQEIRENLMKVMVENAKKQLSLTKVLNVLLKGLSTDLLSADYAKAIVGEHNTPTRHLFEDTFKTCMPHYVLNGTDEIIPCDYVKATDSNKLSKTIKQYRLAVDKDIVVPEGCANFIETTREEPKMQEFTLKYDSGFEEVIKRQARNAEGEVETEQVIVELVPRKKVVWGYTEEVMTAIINAIEIIENAK